MFQLHINKLFLEKPEFIATLKVYRKEHSQMVNLNNMPVPQYSQLIKNTYLFFNNIHYMVLWKVTDFADKSILF